MGHHLIVILIGCVTCKACSVPENPKVFATFQEKGCAWASPIHGGCMNVHHVRPMLRSICLFHLAHVVVLPGRHQPGTAPPSGNAMVIVTVGSIVAVAS